MPVNIIINADDLGKNPTVNNAIKEAIDGQYITSSSILANSNYWDEIHKIVEDGSNASFGVHLNLTEGPALTRSDALINAGIVSDDNVFTHEVNTIKHFSADMLTAIYNELDAQISRIIKNEGIPISHFDGHHHIHTNFYFRDILLGLCHKYKITKVRNRYTSPVSGIKGAAKCVLFCLSYFPGMLPLSRIFKDNSKVSAVVYSTVESYRWKMNIQKTLRTTDYFNSYESVLTDLNNGAEFPDNCTIELMCHPGHPLFEKEYQMIKKQVINSFFTDLRLISYKDL